MKVLRQRLVVGQPIRSREGGVEGIVVAVWPVENGTEALVRPTDETQGAGAATRIFVPAEIKP